MCVLGHVATWREVGEVQSVPIGTSSHNNFKLHLWLHMHECVFLPYRRVGTCEQYYLMQGIIAKIRRLCVATVVYNIINDALSHRRRREGMQCIGGIVLNVTKLHSLQCGFCTACRTARIVEVLTLKYVQSYTQRKTEPKDP